MEQFETSTATDLQLLIRYQDGRDQGAFAEIVRRHGPMVLSVGQRTLGSRQDAEDVCQATFFALAKSVESIRDKQNVAGWLHRVAQKSAVSLQRKNIRWDQKVRRLTTMVKTNGTKNTKPEQPPDRQEVRRVLDEELLRLPLSLSTAFVLCKIEGLTQKQAATQLGFSPSTINDRVVKARSILQRRCARRGLAIGATAVLGQAAVPPAAFSKATVLELTKNASMYAAGQTTAGVGVVSSVLKLATGVITVMKNAKAVAIVLAVLAATVSLHNFAVARQEREALALLLERRGDVRQEDFFKVESRTSKRIRKLFGTQKKKGSILEACAHPDNLCDDDLATLAKLKKLKTLVTNRWRDPATDRHNVISSKELESFGKPIITDEGLQHLSSSENLEAIVLLNTSVSDEGIAAISALPNIETLHISSLLVTDDAIPHITKLKSLAIFSTAGTSITEEGRQKIRQQLPNCNITTIPHLVGE